MLFAGGFSFASYYADHMVLQREPAEAAIWGYANAVGDQVNVTIEVEGLERIYSTAADAGALRADASPLMQARCKLRHRH